MNSASKAATNQDRTSTRGLENSSCEVPALAVDVSSILAPEAKEVDPPPHAEVIEGCRTFITSYYQIGRRILGLSLCN